VERAALKEQVDEVRALFLEYAEQLGFSLCFQGFDQRAGKTAGRL